MRSSSNTGSFFCSKGYLNWFFHFSPALFCAGINQGSSLLWSTSPLIQSWLEHMCYSGCTNRGICTFNSIPAPAHILHHHKPFMCQSQDILHQQVVATWGLVHLLHYRPWMLPKRSVKALPFISNRGICSSRGACLHVPR